MSLTRKAATLALVVIAHFMLGLGLRCGVSLQLASQLVESLLVLVVAVCVYWAIRRRFWVLLTVPCSVLGLVCGEQFATYQLQCGWIACP